MKEGDPSKHYHYSLLEFCSELLLLLLDSAQFDSVQFDSASASESFAAAAAAAVDSADSLAAEKQ